MPTGTDIEVVEKKPRWGLLIGIGVGVLAVGGGLWFLLGRKKSAPRRKRALSCGCGG